MSEDFLSNHSVVTNSKREIKNKNKIENNKSDNNNDKIKIKRVKVMQENYEILNFNEHAKLLNHKYSVPELKKMCRHYKIKVSGNKEELLKRLHEHLLKSSFAIKIQKIGRKYLIRKYNKYHGPAFINRNLCVNETDFLSMENLKDIPYNQFYSYRSEDNYIYGFDVISLYNLISRPGIASLNPYTRSEFPKFVVIELKRLLKLSSILNIPIEIEIEKDEHISIEKQIELRSITLFQKMDELGNYTNSDWFNKLTVLQLVKFIRELRDIWEYRAQLPYSTKREICHPHGDPFLGININNFYVSNFNSLKQISINIMEKFVYSGINRDSQYLGCSYVLSALTLVSNEAAEAMPWLYQSVAHINN